MQISAGYWISCSLVIDSLLLRIERHPCGILIDPRNRLSLSRLQVVLSTLLILFATTAPHTPTA